MKEGFTEVPVHEAIRLLMEGRKVAVDWNGFQEISLNHWFELNVNHFKNSKWYVKDVYDEAGNLLDENGNYVYKMVFKKMIETRFGSCEVTAKERVISDDTYEYVGFSWVTEENPIYGKEDHGYLVYKKDDKFVAFRGYEPSVGRPE